MDYLKRCMPVFILFFVSLIAQAESISELKIESDDELKADRNAENIEANDFAPSDNKGARLFETKLIFNKWKNIQDQTEQFNNQFVLFSWLFSDQKNNLNDITIESMQSSLMTIDVYKRLNDFPEFLILRSNGELVMVALVSTARSGKSTPAGTFNGFQSRSPRHYSSRYHSSPMPYAQFFNGNIAFHGIIEENYPYLGGRASMGCVRMQVDDAAKLWTLVDRVGRKQFQTRVHESNDRSFEDFEDYKEVVGAVYKNAIQRDEAYKIFKREGTRSKYWPSGYFD